MKIVEAYRLGKGDTVKYLAPSMAAAIEHSRATWGRQYDRVERREIEGGLPMLWPLATPTYRTGTEG